jgi:hypothetical protein
MDKDERVIQLQKLIDSAPEIGEHKSQQDFTDEDEHLIHNHPAQEILDSALATGEDQLQREFTDEEVHLIENERAFDQIFGKHLDFAKRDRIALIRLQKEFDLTQKRIKALGDSGRVKRKKSTIAIKGTGLLATIGLCFWSWLLPFAVLTVLMSESKVKQLEVMNSTNLTMTILTLGITVLAWLAVFKVGTFFIRPWVLEKQTLKANGLPWNAKIEGPR